MAPAADEVNAPAPADDAVVEQARRVVLDLSTDDRKSTLHGTVRAEGASGAQDFWGVVDLVRILEAVVSPRGQTEP